MPWLLFKRIIMSRIANFFVGLVAEKKDKQWRASVGRISWWIAFMPAMYIWLNTTMDIQPSHQVILLALATYNLGKHGLGTIKKKEEPE